MRLYCVLCGKYLNKSWWSQAKDEHGRWVPLCWRCHEAWSPPVNARPRGLHKQQYEQRIATLDALIANGGPVEEAS